MTFNVLIHLPPVLWLAIAIIIALQIITVIVVFEIRKAQLWPSTMAGPQYSEAHTRQNAPAQSTHHSVFPTQKD